MSEADHASAPTAPPDDGTSLAPETDDPAARYPRAPPGGTRTTVPEDPESEIGPEAVPDTPDLPDGGGLIPDDPAAPTGAGTDPVFDSPTDAFGV